MRDFGVNKTTVQWLTTGFLLVMGAFTPITAGVIQWLDTRRMVLLTQAVFLTGSLVCAFAPTFGVLVAGRMVQAVSAAFFVPLLFNGILSIYPPERRGTAMGVITMMFTAAPAMGPTLSGIIIDHTHWRVLFGFTTPFMLAAMALVANFNRKPKPRYPPENRRALGGVVCRRLRRAGVCQQQLFHAADGRVCID